MAKFGVNSEGINGLNTLATNIINTLTEIEELSNSISTKLDSVSGRIGEHQDDIEDIITEISYEVEGAEEPVTECSDAAKKLAENYQAILDKQYYGNSKASGEGSTTSTSGGSSSGSGDENVYVDEVFQKHNLYSSLKERMDHTPKSNGTWTGQRGNSTFISNKPSVIAKLAKYGLKGITYKNGMPDFSPISQYDLKIQVTNSRSKNLRRADNKLAEEWNKIGKDGKTDWTSKSVKEYRRKNGLTWHEELDGSTVRLIDTEIHATFGHFGGVGEGIRRRDFEKHIFDTWS